MKQIIKNLFKMQSSQSKEQAVNFTFLDESDFFDSVWYLKRNTDVAQANIDPVMHYLMYGGREGREPSTRFDTEFYLSQLSQLPKTDQACSNPLLHFLKVGQKQGLKPVIDFGLSDSVFASKVVDEFCENLPYPKGMVNSVAIIIPVYNAVEALGACLNSVKQFTVLPCRIIVIDDASPDERVDSILDDYRGMGLFEIYTNAKNLGFTKTVNKGIALAGHCDVVFLNADTVVVPGWLGRLRDVAYSDLRVGTATPFSNNAGAFSAPNAGFNEIAFDYAQFGRAVAQNAKRVYPQVPTGNGFCLYIRRDCLDEVGGLDAEAFPRGYGEENDFCMRAGLKGWRHAIDDSTFIFHVRSASFGEEKTELMAAGRKVIDGRYPDYDGLVKKSFSAEALYQARNTVGDLLTWSFQKMAQVKPRVLYVLSTLTGGTPQTNQDLMLALGGNLDCFVLYCNGEVIRLKRFFNGEYEDLARYVLNESMSAFDHRSDEYDQVVKTWLRNYAFELVHIRHIAWHSLGLVDMVKALGLPCIFSFHDFYTVCPSVKLLDNNQQFCGGHCSASKGECRVELWSQTSFTQLKHAQIKPWQSMFKQMLVKCDAFVTTTEQAKVLICKHYPELVLKPFKVVAHGRDFERFHQLAATPVLGEPIKVLIPGNITGAKGGNLIEALASLINPNEIELHILGFVSPELNLSDSIICHGAYSRDEFAEKVAQIRPNLGVVLSIWPETWCHTLTELWACGVPVVGFDIGAVGERIKRSGAGWLVPEINVSEVLKTLVKAKQKDSWKEACEKVKSWQLIEGKNQSCKVMGRSYLDLYESLVLFKINRNTQKIEGSGSKM